MTRSKLEQARALIAEHIDEMTEAPEEPGEPRWLPHAQAELGVKEVKGSEHNPRILEYLATTTLGKHGRSRDETPWCSAFVNWCMGVAGVEGTNSAMARSWLGWGVDCGTKTGAVVVLKRGKAPSGHVGFYLGNSIGFAVNRISVLGGNQFDSVRVKEYKETDVLGYRWPE